MALNQCAHIWLMQPDWYSRGKKRHFQHFWGYRRLKRNLTAPTGNASTAIIQSLRPISFFSCRSCSLLSAPLVSRLDTSIRTHSPKNTAWITCRRKQGDEETLHSHGFREVIWAAAADLSYNNACDLITCSGKQREAGMINDTERKQRSLPQVSGWNHSAHPV